jgi:serine protease
LQGSNDFAMNPRLPILTAAILLATLVAGAAPAGAVTGIAPARDFAPRRVVVKFEGQRFGRPLGLPRRVGVRKAAAALRENPHVAYAVPDFIATASGASRSTVFLPNDPGTLPGALGASGATGAPSGWVLKQWNFLPWTGPATQALPTSPGGINAVGAWRNLIAAGRPGARGVRVAVLDTGIAFRAARLRPAYPGGLRFLRRSPDFSPRQFARGYNFVNRGQPPVDTNGHGTHVAGTIAEATNNGIGVAGLAYGAKLMPVKVLNSQGRGQASKIAAGIRFAATHGARVINMSFNFGCGRRVPDVDEAIRLAVRKGVVMVAAIGNQGSEACISPPATERHVIGVGGTTEGGCLGWYSLIGKGVDLVAPGGGGPVDGCPSARSDPIYQTTFSGLLRNGTFDFGLPRDYVGTSMAAAHVSGVAAMVIAGGVLKRGPRRAYAGRVARRLRVTARDIGLPRNAQGAGLIDAARATAPSSK